MCDMPGGQLTGNGVQESGPAAGGSGSYCDDEVLIQQVAELCQIVDRGPMLLCGICVPLSFESRGYGYTYEFAASTLNDYFIAKKYIGDDTIALLGELLGSRRVSDRIFSARYDVRGDGNYSVVIGFMVDGLDNLPECLPEYTGTLAIPACRYAKMWINETKAPDRIGYDERMQADEYFIGAFRSATPYVYDSAGCPLNTYAADGDMLTKYEPVKIPVDEAERFDSFRYRLVTLPEMKIACSITAPGDDEFVIFKYFKVEKQVFATKAAQHYLHDYYGFPISIDESQYKSCFGTRVDSFEGMPDCVEQVILPGGVYVHITQLEVNGDNPSMPYDVAFNHLDLFLAGHPGYERDWSRHVIARFRQANCASVFVPLKKV